MGSDHILAVKKLAEWKQKEIAVTAIADRMKERREKAAQIWPEAAIYEEADELLEKEEVYTNLPKVTELTEEKARIQEQLEYLYDEWADLAEEV
jgi:predicted phosphoribosyltransferase